MTKQELEQKIKEVAKQFNMNTRNMFRHRAKIRGKYKKGNN